MSIKYRIRVGANAIHDAIEDEREAARLLKNVYNISRQFVEDPPSETPEQIALTFEKYLTSKIGDATFELFIPAYAGATNTGATIYVDRYNSNRQRLERDHVQVVCPECAGAEGTTGCGSCGDAGWLYARKWAEDDQIALYDLDLSRISSEDIAGATRALLQDLEWSARRQGQGSAMGRSDGRWFASCPCCHQLAPSNDGVEREFKEGAIGHTDECRLRILLERLPS